MKLTFIFLLTLILNVHAEGYSQKVTYRGENVSIEKVFSTIKKQTGYGFFYQKELIRLAKPVTINAVNEDLLQVLTTVFQDQPLEFSIKNKTILVLKKKVPLIVTGRNLIDISELLEVKDIVVKGQITDAQGVTLPGVSIKLKGTTVGATTDIDGRFAISVPDNNSVLVFTYIGYQTQELTVGSRTTLNVKLAAASTALNEVVVTSFGISRAKKSLAYAVTEVKGEEFTKARQNNIATALTGKIAGVNSVGQSTGAGGSSRVVIRGEGSLQGDNQAMYVIDGLPMNNTRRTKYMNVARTSSVVDLGDGISDINPEDIESITVLKGGPAAALYGSRAANGVILITTKKGKVQQGVGIEVSHNFVVGQPAVYPVYQYEYGQGLDGKRPQTKGESLASGRINFGDKIDGKPYVQFDGVTRPYAAVNVKDNWKNFYRPATNMTNSVAFSGGGSSDLVYRLSLSDLSSKDLQPNSTYNRKTANLNTRSVLGKGKNLIIESTVQYNNTKAKNRSVNGLSDGGTTFALWLMPNTVDVRSMAPGYDANFNEVPWQHVGTVPNPYFVINRIKDYDDRDRLMALGSIQYNILDNFSFKVTGMRDLERFETTDYSPAGNGGRLKGDFNTAQYFVTRTTGQAHFSYNTSFLKDFNITAMAGGNTEKSLSESTRHYGTEYIVPDFYSFSNLALQNTGTSFSQDGQNSVFGSADLGYKDLLYLTFSGRQDWFSVLNPLSNSIFYPSVGASFILSDAIKMPAAISFAKLRASWAQVGGATVSAYRINQLYTFEAGGHLGKPLQTTSSSISNPNLKPLTSTTYEGGIELQFLNSRLGLDFTYYNRKTTDDILSVSIASTSGYGSALLNVGELSNRGVELLLTGNPVKSNNFSWDISYNATYNKSEILKLAPGLATIGGSGVGSRFNTLRGTRYLTNASGQTVFNKLTGYAVRGPSEEFGTGVPPYIMGLSNSFRYKNFSLSVLLDGKFGCVTTSTASDYMYRFGLSPKTLPGRENGLTTSGVDQQGLPFTKTWPVDQLDSYYDLQTGFDQSLSLYDASFVKLRSAVLNYRLPINKLKFVKIQSADLSFVANNPFILYKKVTDYDPETSYSTGNDQARTSNTTPRLREFGMNLIVRF